MIGSINANSELYMLARDCYLEYGVDQKLKNF